MKKNMMIVSVFLTLLMGAVFAQKKKISFTSGNPIFPGWYADPEATIFNNQYWIYPTYSATYDEQVFLMLFPPPT